MQSFRFFPRLNVSSFPILCGTLNVETSSTDGLDLNPLFTGIQSFRPAGEGGELKLFDLAGIKLVHGWIADPDSQEFGALSKTEDYDRSMDAVAIADSLTSGQLVYSESQHELRDTPASPKSPTFSGEDKKKIEDG
jgi:hypothetical protein